MKTRMSKALLKAENREYAGTGGRSEENAGLGFTPAFYDYATCAVHLSRFANGSLAPFHILDGLPEGVAAKSTLISGFMRGGYFYTRLAAAKLLREWDRKYVPD